MKPTMIFLINSIALARGGLTRASLKQASFFSELGYETYMLTFNFNPKYPLIREQLISMNKIHKNVIIRNMFEELEGNKEPLLMNKPSKKITIDEIADGLPYDQRANHNAFRIFDNGHYLKYVSFNEDNSLDFIDYFNEIRYRTKREEYDLWGRIKKVSYMDYQMNRPRQSIYFNNKGEAYLSQWINPQNDKVEQTIQFEQGKKTLKTYKKKNQDELKINWLNQVLNNIKNKHIVVVSDTRSTDNILVNLHHPKAAKIWRLHSNHVESPYIVDSKIAPKVIEGYNNIDKFDAAVFLTEEQKNDVMEQNGDTGNLMVIPHYHEPSTSLIKSILTPITKDIKLAVIVSRLSPLKRVDHSIKAFANVIKEVPDARLEIWGIGDEEGNLSKLIGQLNLEEHVILKGFTHNPDEIYKKGLFSILNSKSEGFALSILESMSNETPVISYNVKYGPHDMIIDNKNGFLVEDGDIDTLAEKMITLFNNPDLAIDFGKQAKHQIDNHFSKQIYKKKWLEVVDFALKNKFK